jgi:hypothetical protein
MTALKDLCSCHLFSVINVCSVWLLVLLSAERAFTAAAYLIIMAPPSLPRYPPVHGPLAVAELPPDPDGPAVPAAGVFEQGRSRSHW